jgi:hypothetical protein
VENRHSKKKKGEEVDNENLKLNLKAKMKDEFKQYNEEQIVILKENKQTIIDFLLSKIDSIRIEDLKMYEPIYKCYREKGNCHICNILSNIVCVNSNKHNNNNKEVWLCTNHWQDHFLQKNINKRFESI